MEPGELVIDRTGTVRQAGTDRAGQFVKDFKARAEQDLFVFAKGVMGYSLLTPTLHLPVCRWLQQVPPYRKLVLLPRDHLKTTIAKSAVIHILLQSDGTNKWFPDGIGNLGHGHGTSTRILLGSKTADLSRSALSEIMAVYETNQLLRALWPDRIWDDPKRQAKYWNAEKIVLPRRDVFKEQSIETVGVGGTITGYHFNVHFFDDLVDIESANSPTIMQTAVDWHKASRALMDDPDKSLEIITGTRWAVGDIYEGIIRHDDSVEIMLKAAIEDGKPIFPERFSLDSLKRLQRELRTMFPLLYMNSAADPELTDFDLGQLRSFAILNGQIVFEESDLDSNIEARNNFSPEPEHKPAGLRGARLNRHTYDRLLGKDEYFKNRAGRST
jgi:hypothetical protein